MSRLLGEPAFRASTAGGRLPSRPSNRRGDEGRDGGVGGRSGKLGDSRVQETLVQVQYTMEAITSSASSARKGHYMRMCR